MTEEDKNLTELSEKQQLEKQEEDRKKAKLERIEQELVRPSKWFRSVQKHDNVAPTHIWSINKERIYEDYSNVFIRSFNEFGDETLTRKEEWDYKPKTGFMRVFSEQVLVLPNGKVITPIRQYCETKILPKGTREAFFFDFGKVDMKDVIEGTSPEINTPLIRSSSTQTNPRGTRITISYNEQEDGEPIDIISSTNRAFALESIADETTQIMRAVDDMKLYGDEETQGNSLERALYGLRQGLFNLFRKTKKSPRKGDRWVNGEGKFIKDDSDITLDRKHKLTIKGVMTAKRVIADEGFDDSNLILYTSGKGIRDLTLDEDLTKYLGKCSPEIITENTLERVLGVNLVRSSGISHTSTKTINKPENIFQKIVRVFWGNKRQTIEINGNGSRSILFIPNVAFGLVSGRDLTMEAQRRNEIQAIHVTGTQKIAGLVKNVEAICRISHC